MAKRLDNMINIAAKNLRKSKNSRKKLFLKIIEEGIEWREALNIIIKAIGVHEYALLVGDIRPSNLTKQLNPAHNLRIETLERIIKPLGVKMGFTSKNAPQVKQDHRTY